VLWGWEDRPDPEGVYQRHPAALVPPPYPPKKFAALIDGFREKGQQHAIQVVPGTRHVVRGWHALLALRELGVSEHDWLVRPPDRELRTDEDVERYTAAEASSRDWTATEKAFYTKEVVLPAFAARARLRMAAGRALTEEEERERGPAITSACRVTGAAQGYVQRLIEIERDAPGLYARVKDVAGTDREINVNKALDMLRRGRDEHGVFDMARLDAPAAPGDQARPIRGDELPIDLNDPLDDIKRELDLSIRPEAIEALLEFKDEEGADAWARFVERKRAENR